MTANLTNQQQCDINLRYLLSKRAPYSKGNFTKTVSDLIHMMMTAPYEAAPFAGRCLSQIGLYIEFRNVEYLSPFFNQPYAKEEFCLCIAADRAEFREWFNDMPFPAKTFLHFPGAGQGREGPLRIPLAMCGLKQDQI